MTNSQFWDGPNKRWDPDYPIEDTYYLKRPSGVVKRWINGKGWQPAVDPEWAGRDYKQLSMFPGWMKG